MLHVRPTFAGAYRGLGAAQKPRRGVSLYSRLVNRPLGRVLAAGAARLGISPNAVTVVSGLVTTAALVLLAAAPYGPWLGVVVAALLVLGWGLDSADGQLARLLGRSSAGGEWLDHVVDAAKHAGLHLAVLVFAYRHLDVDPAWLLVPIGYAVVAVVVFTAGTLRELLGRLAAVPRAEPATADGRSLRAVLLLPADFGILAWAFLTLAWPPAFLVAYPSLFLANLGVGAALLVKWARELSSADPA